MKPGSASNPEDESWLPLLLEGTLEDGAAAAPLAELKDTGAPDGAVLAALAIHRLLPLALRGEEDPAFVREVTARLKAAGQDGTPAAEDFVRKVVGRLEAREPFFRRWPVQAAAALLALSLVVWSLQRGEPPTRRGAGMAAAATGWEGAAPEIAARMVRAESASWETAPDRALRAGARLTLRQGLAEVHFRSGTQLILEGPADLEIAGPNKAQLRSGRVVAEVPEAGRGFILDSPRGRLIDHGTKFGVSVEASGETEVHVLDGLVEARQTGGPGPVLLRGREALRLSPDRQERLLADDGEFVTEMPPSGFAGAPFVHWPMDGPALQFIDNRGQGFKSAETRLQLLCYREGGTGPQPVPGQFGSALAFDGQGDYAACDWLGIPGAAARTVAFWIKVPADSGTDEGFGVVGWGEHSTHGGAWQVSPNPLERDGPLGRLRVGTQEGHVIGTRDLRDGQWHHVAVVMYGGSGRPNTATHVMLYVDGTLDPASRKKLRDIRTDTGRALHGVWIGRNLGFKTGTLEGDWSGGRFFRGGVDEVYIVAAALNQPQIQRLMRENQFE